MSLVTVPGKIAMLADHTIIVMAKEDRHQAVCIAGDVLAMESDSADRLTECLAIFEEIANAKLQNGDVAYDGRVWITSSDMIGCPFPERH